MATVTPATGTRRPSGVPPLVDPITDHPSPNFGPRRGGLKPSIVVLHYTAMQTSEAALDRLCDPEAEVSAHYLICKRGQVTRIVDEEHRAWHAGVGEWRGQTDINSRSIGIELDNSGTAPFPEPQMRALEALLRGILGRWGIEPRDVIGHSDMAPGRKIDPGAKFDWARLAKQGLAAVPSKMPRGQARNADDFRAAAHAAGFTADVDDATLLSAVRLRFRPYAQGPLSAKDFIFPANA